MIITIAYAANNVRTSVGMFTLMYHIQKNNAVTATAPIGLGLRGIGAAGMCLGTLLCGFRLVPVTGVSHLRLVYFLCTVCLLLWFAVLLRGYFASDVLHSCVPFVLFCLVLSCLILYVLGFQEVLCGALHEVGTCLSS